MMDDESLEKIIEERVLALVEQNLRLLGGATDHEARRLEVSRRIANVPEDIRVMLTNTAAQITEEIAGQDQELEERRLREELWSSMRLSGWDLDSLK